MDIESDIDNIEEEEKETVLTLPSIVGSHKKKLKKSEIKANKLVEIHPGIIRLNGLPHGFFEQELFSYFSQFGKVTRLKLFRSKKTGNSRGYCYIEFEDEDVAKIACDTMNGYLMFRTLIKCRIINREKIDVEKLFKNWKTIHKPMLPSQKRTKYNRTKSMEQLTKSLGRREKKLQKQQELLDQMGIKYQLQDFIPLKSDTKSEVVEKKEVKKVK
ncbi:unnamed protein product [Didymodactylos carnosus]|uniref:RRM domain-containing protein n=1 Tax=Didymodactylos carnosus TaxID=1234261 RepID=A0A814KK43_9BILA|nr:unnamed protein product [Didymodactylos carnosus]CAF1408008.1 unnamed protein product [Didymodactylos carnosus]CAF3821854.1 unnamed protein product [Didymodactylos carnosus]CAF4213130.1 unnamed protein product [Didymodactylos carnosus]